MGTLTEYVNLGEVFPDPAPVISLDIYSLENSVTISMQEVSVAMRD